MHSRGILFDVSESKLDSLPLFLHHYVIRKTIIKNALGPLQVLLQTSRLSPNPYYHIEDVDGSWFSSFGKAECTVERMTIRSLVAFNL